MSHDFPEVTAFYSIAINRDWLDRCVNYPGKTQPVRGEIGVLAKAP